MEKLYWPIEDLKPWEQNPKIIKDDKFENLKKAITEEGQDLPLLIDNREKTRGTIISGNMRYLAMKTLGLKKVWVNLKEVKSDAHFFKLAVQHNMEYGEYIPDQLAQLADLYKNDINLQELDVELGRPLDLQFHLNNYGPGNPERPPENSSTEINVGDKTDGLKHKCPSCGFEFNDKNV